MTNATLRGKPDAGNPHVRFDEGEVASTKPRRGSLLYKIMIAVVLAIPVISAIAGPGFGIPNREYLLKPGSQKGCVVFVNCQNDAKVTDWTTNHVDYIGQYMRIKAEVRTGNFNLLSPVIEGDVTIYVVDDAKLPMSLIANEAKWAVVNVSALKTDKMTFYEARVKKMLIRVFSTLCGAASSQYPHSYTSCAVTPEMVDKFVTTGFVVDIAAKIPKYIEGFGVHQGHYASYQKACREGWASAPTNEVQKAIWERVHEAPTNPIRIKFDPNRDK